MWGKKDKGIIDTLQEKMSSPDKEEEASTTNMIGSFMIPPLWCNKCYEGILSELRKVKGVSVRLIEVPTLDAVSICGMVEFVSRGTAIHALDGTIIPSLAKEACHMVRVIFSLDNGDITYSIRQGEVISRDDQLGISRRSQYKELEECERLLSILQSKEWYSEPELEQIYYRNISKLPAQSLMHGYAEKLELLMNLGLIQRADNTTKLLYGITTRGIKFIKKGIMELLWYDKGYMSTLHKSIATWHEGIATLRGAVTLITDHDDRFLLPEAKMAEDLEEQRSKEFNDISRRIGTGE